MPGWTSPRTSPRTSLDFFMIFQDSSSTFLSVVTCDAESVIYTIYNISWAWTLHYSYPACDIIQDIIYNLSWAVESGVYSMYWAAAHWQLRNLNSELARSSAVCFQQSTFHITGKLQTLLLFVCQKKAWLLALLELYILGCRAWSCQVTAWTVQFKLWALTKERNTHSR